ncbi:hypothetical protein IJT10_08940 [bacterium]|nr:hypothetical protein [bacterium]
MNFKKIFGSALCAATLISSAFIATTAEDNIWDSLGGSGGRVNVNTGQLINKAINAVETAPKHGKIDHNKLVKGQCATVTFEKMPRNFAEFEKFQAQYCTEPQGAVAAFIVAMNIYLHDKDEGKRCFDAVAYKSYVIDMSLIKDKIGRDGSDGYSQPFLPRAFFRGATPRNGYAPEKPYKVDVSVNNGRPYQRLSSAQAPVIYLNVKTKGTDSGMRGVEVVKPKGKDYFYVLNVAGLISQVKFPDDDAPEYVDEGQYDREPAEMQDEAAPEEAQTEQ